jgi:hypothetical protein
MAVRFAKAPAGIYAFIVETKRDSAKEGGWPRLVPRKDHRLVISRSAALSPCPAETSKYLTPFIFLKSEGGQAFGQEGIGHRNEFFDGKKWVRLMAQAYLKSEIAEILCSMN